MELLFNKNIKIGKFEISENSPTFIICEAGVNHNGDMNLAKKLIDKALEVGADAVKFQAFKTEELILKDVEKASYQKRTTGESETQFGLLKRLELTKAQHIELKNYCDVKGIMFLITPFDEVSLDELDFLDLNAYKVSSTDITNLPFLKKIAKKGKPIILSTGMCYMEEVQLALEEIHAINKDVIVLHCTANYPVPDDEVNLKVLPLIKERFNVLVGYSDHSVGIGASPYSLPLGAKILEKHFTLDKSFEGPDHEASMDVEEFRAYVNEVRKVEKFLGTAVKVPQLSEINSRKSLQKSMVARRLINAGEIFTEENLVAKRSGGAGISPIYARNVFGKAARKNFEKNEIISL